jgi:hypothetical protein
MGKVHNYRDIKLVVSLATGIIGDWWVNLINAQFGTPVAVGCTAVSAPKFYAYYDSHQMIGLLGGLKGASEYERLTKRWIAQRGLEARFVRSYGATEVFPPEDADCIVDNAATGSFQNPRPFVPLASGGGHGAWELALRYSHTDLNFHAGSSNSAPAADSIRGGVQDIWAVGINLYANPNLRWQLNYLRIDVDRLNPRTSAATSAPFGAEPASPPIGVQIGQSLSAWALRTQYGF